MGPVFALRPPHLAPISQGGNIVNQPITFARVSGLLAVLMLAVGCRDPLGPDPDAPPIMSAAFQGEGSPRLQASGSTGSGAPIPSADRQEFELNVAWDLSGRLFYRDWSFVRVGGLVATIAVEPSDASTAFTAFRTSSARCSDPARGTEVDGFGRVDDGKLVFITVVTCDNGPAGTGDVFRIIVTEAEYERGGSLSSGDIVESGTAPSTETRVGGLGAIGPGPATLGSDRQEFDFDVNASPSGRLAYSDYSVVRNGAAGNMFIDRAADAATEVRSFHQPSARCVRITGTGRVDTGELLRFYVDVCDNATPGTGFDAFTMTIPDRVRPGVPYVRSGSLSTGDIVLGEGAPPAAAATALLFTVQPGDTRAMSTIQPAVRVTAVDAQGNPAISFAGLVTIAIGRNGGLLMPGTLSGTRSVHAVNGVATFADLSIDQIGNGYTLRVTASGLTDAESRSFNVGM
jgi:hypothetical protein